MHSIATMHNAMQGNFCVDIFSLISNSDYSITQLQILTNKTSSCNHNLRASHIWPVVKWTSRDSSTFVMKLLQQLAVMREQGL